MKALIFAAGLGTRLKPLTDTRPKALVEINGIPMLGLLIEKLKAFGYNSIVINVHHFASQIIDYINTNNNFNIEINISDESNTLLDTGGGLMFAKKFLEKEENFLIHNVDIYTDIDLNAMMQYHIKGKYLATLAVKNRISSKYLQFDEFNKLCAWRDAKTGEQIIVRQSKIINEYAFSGVHILNSQIFELINKEGKFSIIPEYLRLAEKESISAYVHNENTIIDIGKHETLQEVEKIINQTNQ